MRKYLTVVLIFAMFSSCTEKQKDFADIKTGMTKEQVLQQAGEPDKKNDILISDLWVYNDADRTVVFRKDTVYDIITSASARIDSIEATLKEAGRDVKEKLKSAGDTIDSASLKIKNKIMRDSSNKN
ncbi:MAG: outer membrane protein assembly factor BamE [Daejeonella sp.]